LGHRDGQLVRGQGIKTEAAERVVPMLPALYDLLIEHKAEFGYGPHDPVFATRNGRRNTVDNVRRTIVEPRSSAPTSCWRPAASVRSRGARRTRCDAPSPRSWPSSTCRHGGRCI
jgi:hypothetical protein